MSKMEKKFLINNLHNFVEEQKSWLKNTLDSIGWNVLDLEKITQSSEAELVTCSISSGHRIPPESIQKHEDKCEKRNGHYPEIIDVLDYKFNEDEQKNCLVNDFNTNSNITSDDQILNSDKKKREELSSQCLMELLAAERDAKRRRAAHRGKRVHSNKKTYNEVLREVISSQMETLTDPVDEDNKSEVGKKDITKKDSIQPSVGSYLGVGSKCYVGNPYKRWIYIEKEELELINEMKISKNEKYSKKGSRCESSFDNYKTSTKPIRDYTHKRDNYKYREQVKEKDYETGKNNFKYDERTDHHLRKDRDRSRHSSRYHDEKYSDYSSRHNDEKYSDKNDGKRKRSDSHLSSHESTKHKKKHKKRSRERSVHKKSRHKSRHRDSNAEDDRSH